MPIGTTGALIAVAAATLVSAGVQAHGVREQSKAAKASTKRQSDAQSMALNDAASQRRQEQVDNMKANRQSADLSALVDASRRSTKRPATDLTGGAPGTNTLLGQ